MYQDKKTKLIMSITFVSAFINIISNIVLIPLLGMMGSVMATFISFVSLFIIQYWYAKKCFFIPFHWNLIIPVALILIAIYSLVEFLSIQNVFYSLCIKFSISLLISIFFFKKYKNRLSTLFIRK